MGTSTCNSTEFIMNPYYCGSCQQQPVVFSNCSINEMHTVLGSRATCLDAIASPLCGNGQVDPGEKCDSGDPFHGSAGCTAQCTWHAVAVCDDTKGACCRGCQLMPATTECRASADPFCDVAEYCTGASPVCPANKVLHPGTACASRAGDPGRGRAARAGQTLTFALGMGSRTRRGATVPPRLDTRAASGAYGATAGA
ncbi:myxococcus cysteine-rich [Allomyces macrogynus ATCC 38327]|uniref:Disintegrin and metalloproteinase domain-containing protein B n=1 Tax=Allomyces macrogynus (strain ATCC 38327) TaxID=578462 RepID=A0A0L0T6S2_ALLM3|nr:myxococcus cysteine-rich [Allomyces macrogynus ATCC 38327]|eukprot:KNE70274.1 myxococcus cysteine-rich [Allomyces macrogynus ATCC 38327]